MSIYNSQRLYLTRKADNQSIGSNSDVDSLDLQDIMSKVSGYVNQISDIAKSDLSKLEKEDLEKLTEKINLQDLTKIMNSAVNLQKKMVSEVDQSDQVAPDAVEEILKHLGKISRELKLIKEDLEKQKLEAKNLKDRLSKLEAK